MTDPFDVATPTQRRLLTGALVLYAAVFVLDIARNTALTSAATDLLLVVIVVPAALVVIRRATDTRPTDRLAVVTGFLFLVAGIAIGYGGLATLDLVPPIIAVDVAGTVSLVVALVLYLYRSR